MQAAAAVIHAATLQHDSSELIVVSAVLDGKKCYDVLIDPGSTSNFVRRDWATASGMRLQPLSRALEVKLADDKVAARLTAAVSVSSVTVQGSKAPCTLTVMDHLSHKIILGLPWLRRAGVKLGCDKVMTWNGRRMYPVMLGGRRDGAQLQGLKVAEEHEARMGKLLQRFPAAFSKELRKRSAAALERAVKCSIELKDPQCKPVYCRERRRSPRDQTTLKACTEEMLAAGLIQPSHSPWCSQPVLVAKVRDGVVLDEKRPCWDYRLVNDRLVGDAHPLPLPENMFDALQGSQLFSKLDLTKGFWQIPLEEKSKAILAMSTPLGLMEPLFMPFGMKNAPAVFQREMQRVLRDRLGKGVMVFIDDILIYSATVEEHEQLVSWVLTRLQEEGYYANPEKCEFFQREVSFLGHVISDKGIAVQQHKVKAVNDWAPPTSRKEVRAFLGLTGYSNYRKFIPQYCQIALPLTELTKDNVQFRWGDAEQRAFEQLKERLTTADVLAHPDPLRQYIINSDASGYAVAAVLSQDQADGTRRPIAHCSRKMTPAETRYAVHDQELLAIVRAIREWRCYLNGSPHRTLILTDHKGLEWISTKDELSGRQARWIEQLSEISHEVRYIQGKENGVADALSRRADLEQAVATEMKEAAESSDLSQPRPRLNIQLGAVPALEGKPMWETRVESLGLRDELKKAAADDKWYAAKLAEANPTDGLLRGDGLLWTIDGRVYVPDDREVQRKMLHEVHDAPSGGHMGQRKTLRKLQEKCYWLGMWRTMSVAA